MSMSLNRVQIIGNLTKDPELKQIPGGQMVATFSVATNLTWTDKAGQKQQKVEYHNIVVWAKLAEICAQYLKKGSKAFFEGRLQTRDWEGEDGIKRYRTEIVVENMIMLDRKGDAMGEGAGYDRQAGGLNNEMPANNSSAPAVAASAADDITIDDLPF